jgi:TM2 domain-containing membrane protein YozV
MYCSYHPSNAARVACTNCERALCTYCDHRIKGHPYCQDCIVQGIENLSRFRSAPRASKKQSRLAALCALIPGLGAVYNRQNFKALVHFVTVVGLFKLSGIRPLEVLGVLAGGIFYLYSIVDAYRSAGRISAGESPQVDEERLKRAFRRRAPGVGVLLLILGIGLLIYMIKPFSLELVRLLPVALVLLGGYLIVAHLKRSREDDYTPGAADHKAQPYPLFPLQREHERAHRFSPRGSGIFGRRDDLR